ncbi:U4/U6-U5 snRNP complex subunit [Saccharomycopsis crataegensis]|uniref:Amine oxidase n=1 Tax=Saccharomycopsis crataegensis TaxID=43959 RepID=A0AAV5QNJ5_9ASCO|nr:U4/U6-U5 snRNP complex subunit [Saccharomycopsis crataegensis]
MDRLSQVASHTTSTIPGPANPLDPLSPLEIQLVSGLLRDKYSKEGTEINFNTITLKEPSKSEYLLWKESSTVPPRVAYFIILIKGFNGLHEGLVDIRGKSIVKITKSNNVQPMLTIEDLSSAEEIIRNDPEVIRQCGISGVPANEMDRIYCDPWAIGYDERWGSSRRLQQAMVYYRSNENDSQYSHPLDFCPIIDPALKKVIFIDIPKIRKPLSKHKHSNFHSDGVKEKYGGYRTDGKPINVTQPEGVSFKMENNTIEWSNFKFHVGFNYREGIVLSDITYNDHGNVRPIFHRMSLCEMIVPYGCPDYPHHRKHALDIGEYGAGFMTNSLALGCDCKGVIHYLDAHMVNKDGSPITVKNAVCIHEEDDGILYKHSDFRDDYRTSTVARASKLIVSQIFTAANYEYCIYYNFMQDGSIKLEVKLTGILNTYVCSDEGSEVGPWGTIVYPNTNAHNHQHLFSLRIHPRIDGDGNSAAAVDAARSPYPTGHQENMYGNGFYAKKTVFKTIKDSKTNYESSTGRSWDLFNPKKLHPYSKKPASYKLVSTFCPPLLAQPGSLPYKRASWANDTVTVIPYQDIKAIDAADHGYDRTIYPSGNHVCQWSGDGMVGMRKWVADGSAEIEDTDIVMFHTFGITHFPAPEDFCVMPAEKIEVLLRPRNFFLENPGLDVVPSHTMTTSEARKIITAGVEHITSTTDKTSKLAFSGSSCGCNKHVDQAILSEDERLVIIRFGRDSDKDCRLMDELLYKIAEKIKNFAVVYLCNIDEVPDFNQMYELYDPMTIMFFFRNKHMMCDFGTGNNNKLNFVLDDTQELIDIIEVIYRGARKGKGLVVSPKDYSSKGTRYG